MRLIESESARAWTQPFMSLRARIVNVRLVAGKRKFLWAQNIDYRFCSTEWDITVCTLALALANIKLITAHYICRMLNAVSCKLTENWIDKKTFAEQVRHAQPTNRSIQLKLFLYSKLFWIEFDIFDWMQYNFLRCFWTRLRIDLKVKCNAMQGRLSGGMTALAARNSRNQLRANVTYEWHLMQVANGMKCLRNN